jgi:hypothetical protein
MTYDPGPRDPRRHTAVSDGLGPGVIAAAALAVLALAGIAFYIVSMDRTSIVATDTPSAVQQSVPPKTTGEGGAASRMPPPADPDRGR